MLFRLLVTALMIVQLAGAYWDAPHVVVAQSSSTKADADTHMYMPYVSYELPLQAVAISAGRENPNFSDDFFVQGYVRNRSTRPVYSVTVLLHLTVYIAYTTTVYIVDTFTQTVSTAFIATLPGQTNPFLLQVNRGGRYSLRVDHASIIEAVDPAPDDPTYVQLDVSNWLTGTGRITGTVRNTSDLPVRDMRVVMRYTDNPLYETCQWKMAVLMTTTLQPGEATTYYAYQCGIGTLLPVAQGLVSP